MSAKARALKYVEPPSDPVDRDNITLYTENVRVTIDPELLLQQLNKLLANSGLKSPLTSLDFEALLRGFPRRQDAPNFIIDDETGLRLPPEPKLLYRDRKEKYGNKISYEDFIKIEYADYLDARLLYSEHLKLVDASLHRAIRNRCETTQIPLVDEMRRLGVLTHEDVYNPTSDISRQAANIRALNMRRVAAAIIQQVGKEF